MENKVRFMYVRDANWEPCGCIAISVNRMANRVEYGLSIRHPSDAADSQGRRVRFDRKEAQRVAVIRLAEGSGRAYIPPSATQHEITASVLGDIIASGKAPSRAVRFAKRWLNGLFFNY